MMIHSTDVKICTEFRVKQQKEARSTRNSSQEKEAERGVTAEKSEDCSFVEKGLQVFYAMLCT